MIRKIVNYALIFLFVFQLAIPFIDGIVMAADTKTLYIDWASDDFVESQPSEPYVSNTGTKTITKDIGSYITGVIKGCRLFVEGQEQSGCSFSGTSVTVNANGEKKTVYGRQLTDPGHHLFRRPEGKSWEHKAKTTPAVHFTPDDVKAGASLTERPGLIPSQGLDENDKPFNYESSGGRDLRYSFEDPDDPGPDYSKVGYAVTASYEAEPPDKFYFTEPESYEDSPGTPIASSDLNENSIKVTGASESTSETYTGEYPEPYAWGAGKVAGKGMFKVRRDLSQNLEEDIDYFADPKLKRPPYGEDRNYYMTVDTEWEAETYVYSGYIEVEYELPQTPDLAALYIKADKACIQVGDTVTISYAFKNIGIDTTTPFEVQLKVDGSVVKTDQATSANTGVLLGGSYSYTFSTSAPKDFTLVVDSGMSVNDNNRSNNTISQTFEPQTSCDGGGGTDPGGGGGNPPGTMTGRVTPEKETINWKDSNLIWFEVEPQGCTLEKFKWEFKGNGGVWNMPPSQAGWYTNTSGNKNAILFEYNSATRMYPGNIQDGQVQVRVTALDSCGTESVIGPGTFTIGPPPPDTPPELRIAFIDPTDGSETGQVIVGDRVDLKVMRLFDADGDPLTLQWLFTSDPATDWIKGLPAKHGWTTPYNKMSYTGMTADVVGLQLVCATASDGVKTTQACANLNVIPPNPIPKIKGPQVVKVNRPVNPPWDASQSYSPVKGRTIDHSRDEWTNAYTKYTTVGEQTISLNVFDNTGLKSLTPDTWKLTVIPDQPPVIDFLYSSTISRLAPSYFKNNSRSPDGDTIVKYYTWYGYDANNNGSCNPYENLISTDNANFAFHPTKVGKYCFRLYAEEDYGLNSTKDYTVEVTNDNPEVTFMVSGQTNEPVPITTVPLPSSTLLGDGWTNTSLDKSSLSKNFWSITPSGTLTTNPRNNDVSIGLRQYMDSTPSYGVITGNPNLTYPHSDSTVRQIGSLGNVSFPGNSNDYLKEKTPDVYLGDNMFIQIINRYTGSYSTPYFYLLGTQLPAPIELMVGDYKSLGAISVREDLDEIILYWQYDSWDSYVTYQYNRYKISALKAGNIVPDYSYKTTAYVVNHYYPDINIKFSDGTDYNYMDGFIKTPIDYKRINLVERKIESYSFDNIRTPYKVETYDHINPISAGDWNSGVYYKTFPYLRGFQSAGGKVLQGSSCGIIWYDGVEQKLNFVNTCYWGGPDGASTPTGISSSENYIIFRESRSYSPKTLVANIRTGSIHSTVCWDEEQRYDVKTLS